MAHRNTSSGADDDRPARIHRMRQQGLSWAAIAQRIGTSDTNCIRLCRQHLAALAAAAEPPAEEDR